MPCITAETPSVDSTTTKSKTVRWPSVNQNTFLIQHETERYPGSDDNLDKQLSQISAYYICTSFIASILFLFIFGLLLSIVCYYCRTKTARRILIQRRTEMEAKKVLVGNKPKNPIYEILCSDLSIQVFSREEINLTGLLSYGCFGKIFKGELKKKIVTVKVLKRKLSKEAVKDVEMMAKFSHPNVLNLIGIVRNSNSKPPWLLYEFLKYQDLVDVLQNAHLFPYKSTLTSGQFDQPPVDSLESATILVTHNNLKNFALQIAEGMSYFASQNFVHRDLAARNCLLSENGVIKISDFALFKEKYSFDYYKIGVSRLLPLRWMSPESILHGIFTTESDVYSYGVVLWEIFSYGKQPYYGRSDKEVIPLILARALLCRPSKCPQIIWQIITGCWKSEPKNRLDFKQIRQIYLDENSQKDIALIPDR